MSQGNEKLKESVTSVQQKLHDVFNNETEMRETARQTWDQAKAKTVGSETEPSLMDRLTNVIHEGSQKFTHATENLTQGVKKTLSGGGSEASIEDIQPEEGIGPASFSNVAGEPVQQQTQQQSWAGKARRHSSI